MNVVVTGACGQLGRELMEIAGMSDSNKYYFTDIEGGDGIDVLDITDAEAVRAYLAVKEASVLVNCAAFTDVEGAEDNPDAAFALNAAAPGAMAKVCAESSVFFIHISTDYVFDGSAGRPYREDDEAVALSVYGESKYQGEVAVAEATDSYIVLRTSWLYSRFGKNFVTKMEQLFRDRDCITVVSDQVGTPTNAADLAGFIFDILEDGSFREHPGVYNFSNEGVCSWYDFAMAVAAFSEDNCDILPCRSCDYPVKAERPHYSVLDKSKVKRDFCIQIPYWRDSLEEMMLERCFAE